MQLPSIGRIIRYVLSQHDCNHIWNRRMRMANAMGLPQEDFGNLAAQGQIVPAQIVCVFHGKPSVINGQAMLDGLDTHWLRERHYDEAKTPGTWHWPEREMPIKQSEPDALTRLDAELVSTSGSPGQGTQISGFDVEGLAAPLQPPYTLILEAVQAKLLTLCSKIEMLPGSSEQTEISVMASNLYQVIHHARRDELLPPYLADFLSRD